MPALATEVRPAPAPNAPDATRFIVPEDASRFALLEIPVAADTAQTTGQYASVNLSNREPLLPAAAVAAQLMGGRHARTNNQMAFGDFMAAVSLPAPSQPGIDAATRHIAALTNSISIFRRGGGPDAEYQIMGPAAIARITSRNGDIDNLGSSIVVLRRGSQPLVVGNAPGNWLPSVGYDHALISLDPTIAHATRTVSKSEQGQGTFTVDEHGDLHFTQPPERTNPSRVMLRKTTEEHQGDAAFVAESKAINARQRAQLGARVGTQVLHGLSRRLEAAPLEPVDFEHPRPQPQTYESQHAKKNYTGRHRRTGILGRLAARLRS
jgi:hypothetical protein